MKPKLIIISDLWGLQKAEWLNFYIDNLHKKFAIDLYDSCSLGNIDISNYNETSLHKQFVDFGIKKAVKKLTEIQKEASIVLAFSVGGTIAWQSCLQSLKADKLIAISATRLRYETEKPKCNIALFFGNKDQYKPNTEWFEKLNLEENCINGEHSIYKNQSFAEFICNKILDNQ